MQIGQQVITERAGEIIKCFILEKRTEEIILSDGNIEFSRKYWEVQVIRE